MGMPACSHLMSNFYGTLLVMTAPAPRSTSRIPRVTPSRTIRSCMSSMWPSASTTSCAHNTSWEVFEGNRQITHPHPSFTPDNRQVLFTSDVDGKPALYLADLLADRLVTA